MASNWFISMSKRKCMTFCYGLLHFDAVRPVSSAVRGEDCSFEKGLCGWENVTSSGSDRSVTWQRAFFAHRPAQLLDKTFGASGDFVFFDIFSPNQKSRDVRLRSPLINSSPDEEAVYCFSFWFAAFGVEESTSLRVVKVTIGESASSTGSEDVAEEGASDNSDEETVEYTFLKVKAI